MQGAVRIGQIKFFIIFYHLKMHEMCIFQMSYSTFHVREPERKIQSTYS